MFKLSMLPAIVALICGILVLVVPRFLHYLVALFLIIYGLFGLGILR